VLKAVTRRRQLTQQTEKRVRAVVKDKGCGIALELLLVTIFKSSVNSITNTKSVSSQLSRESTLN
jgi:hypothetical protein